MLPHSALTRYIRPITEQEEESLARRILLGDKKALDRLILSHYRFVAKVAYGFRNQGVELEDLISEGILGLHRAATTFDLAKGNRFMSYAVWWVRQAITKCIHDTGTMVRVPANYYTNASKKTEEQTAEHKDAIRRMRNTASISHLAESGMDFESTEVPPDWTAENDSDRQYIESLLQALHPADRTLVRRRFGLDTGEKVDYRVLGQSFNLSHERIRQRLDKSIRRMNKRATSYAASH